MTRKMRFAAAFALAATMFTAEAEQGRRRPVNNPQLTVDGLIAAASSDELRVQTQSGIVSVALGPTTEIERAGSRETLAASSLGQYTLTDAIVGNDGIVSARRVVLFDVPASVASEETVRIEGKVASVSPETSTLALVTRRGILTISVNETTVIRRDGSTIRLADIAVGSFALVVGKPTGETTILALEIDVHTAGQPPQHDAVAGEIVKISATEHALVLKREFPGRNSPVSLVAVRTTEQTEIYRHRERIAFADIKLGDFALAVGELDSAGALVAKRIDVADPPGPAPRIAGRVLEVSSTTREFTVAVERGWMNTQPTGPVTVVVNDETKIYRQQEQVRFSEIKSGDFVQVAGAWNDAKALVASVVHIVTLHPVPPTPVILGEITAIEPATRTLVVRVRAVRPLETTADGTVKVLVSDDTTIYRNGEPSRFAALTVGEVVVVVGEVRDDGAILAKRIDVIAPPRHDAGVMGDVATVSAGSIEIIVPQPYPTFQAVRVTILADDATQIFRNGERVRLQAIQVGDMLFASGEWRDQRTLLARRIEAKSRHAPGPGMVKLQGRIEAVSPGGLRVAAQDLQIWFVNISPMTLITRAGIPVQFDSLVVGEIVEVSGMSTGDHAVAALRISVVR